MEKLTKERIEQYASDPRMCNINDEIREMASILLAGMEQEPVAYMTYKGCLLHAGDPKVAEYSEPTPLYDAAQPLTDAERAELQEYRKAAPVEINDEMAFAFCRAISDATVGADEVEDIKTGLRAAFANITTPQPAPAVVPDGLRMALSNAGIAAPESDGMLFATHEKYIQLLVNWVRERKPFQPGVPVAYTDEDELRFTDGEAWIWKSPHGFGRDVALYRHAQPAPAVEAVPVVPDEAIVGEMPFLGTKESAYVSGWNACRAAMLNHSGEATEKGKADGALTNEVTLPAAKIKPVADLYGITSPTGSETSFTFDAIEARNFIDGGWSCQEYVELERYQQACAGNSPVIPDCWCHTCRPVTITDMRLVVCPDCGNKRCPHANDHRNVCSGSNEPGQEGSA